MCSRVYLEIVEADAPLGKVIEFAEEILRVENDACADEAERILIKYTRRNKVQLIGLTAAGYGMTRIVAALCTDYYVRS